MYEQETSMLISIDLLIRLAIVTCKYKSIYCDMLSTNRVNSLTIQYNLVVNRNSII